MALINLNKRVTDKWEVRCDNLESPDSFIYIKDRANEKVANPASMEIEVGDVYILPRNGQQYKIPEEGLSIDPKQSVVIYSRQKISLPYNAFGLITGKGNYIFQGCFISSGKIDPGFDGFLKIGFYNGSNKKILLKKGIGFASVFFINTDLVAVKWRNTDQLLLTILSLISDNRIFAFAFHAPRCLPQGR